MAGPNVIQSQDHIFKMCRQIKQVTDEVGVKFIFKSSFDKANRTSAKSFRGPGIDEGLKVLQAVKTTFDVPIVTDIHEPHQVRRRPRNENENPPRPHELPRCGQPRQWIGVQAHHRNATPPRKAQKGAATVPSPIIHPFSHLLSSIRLNPRMPFHPSILTSKHPSRAP